MPSQDPEQDVYVVDRVELHCATRLTGLVVARNGDDEKLLGHRGVAAAVMRTYWPLYRELLADDWSIAYEDDLFEVLVLARD